MGQNFLLSFDLVKSLSSLEEGKQRLFVLMVRPCANRISGSCLHASPLDYHDHIINPGSEANDGIQCLGAYVLK